MTTRTFLGLLPGVCLPLSAANSEAILIPQIEGEWWTVAGDPDVSPYTTPDQQPVDFGVWQAADGTWQLWSCIRKTSHPGKTRLFHRWEGKNLTDRNWKPGGIAMVADPKLGETEGGLQAPHVIKYRGLYYMFYGDWEHICLATSRDGKQFERQIRHDGKTGMFTEGGEGNTRDPMVLKIGDLWHLYYTAHVNKLGVDYLRTSKNLRDWSPAKKVASGGSAGTTSFTAECPFVYEHKPSRGYYLFRTQRYGVNSQTMVYRSKDPANFGVGTDEFLVATLPYAAPEIIEYRGQTYIAALLPSLKGIQIAKLSWKPKS